MAGDVRGQDRGDQVRRQRHDRRRPEASLRPGHRVHEALRCAPGGGARRGSADLADASATGHHLGVPRWPAGHQPGGDGGRPDGARRPGRARAGGSDQPAQQPGGGYVRRGRRLVRGRTARHRDRRRGGRPRPGRRCGRGEHRGHRGSDRRRSGPGGRQHRPRPERRRAQRQRRHRGGSTGRRPGCGAAGRAHRRGRPVRRLAPQRLGDQGAVRLRAARADADAGVGHAAQDGGLPSSRRGRSHPGDGDRRTGPARLAAGDLHQRRHRHHGHPGRSDPAGQPSLLRRRRDPAARDRQRRVRPAAPPARRRSDADDETDTEQETA